MSGNGVVLVVDDEEIVRHFAKQALQRYGYEVLLAEDGSSAIDIMRQAGDRISLVLLDLTMPGMDGVETLPQLKRLRPDVRILLTSGYSEAEASERFAGQDLAGFIQKPYTAAKLAERVKQVCAATAR